MRRIDMATETHPLSYYLGLSYPYTVVPDDGSFFVEFPDLPNCFTQVDDASEIVAMAEEIRTLWIESEYERGATIPEPSSQGEFSGKFMTRVPRSLHKDLASSARREGMSLNAYVGYLLAERNMANTLAVRLDGIEAQVSTISERLPYSVQIESSVTPLDSRRSRKESSNERVYRKAVAA
jgi:antitoxin HicB